MKILIIEDEHELASSIAEYLTDAQYNCELAPTYDIALSKISLYQYDCIILDIMLPDGSGMNLLQEIKKQNKEDGVIIISAKGSIDDKIRGLHTGADDYLAKPFHLSELAARIYSIIRRRNFSNSDTIVQNEIQLDLLGKAVSVNGQLIQLTRKEFELLLYLIKNKNKVVSKSALAEHLSGDIADMLDNHDFVYAHIKNLKKKLVENGYQHYLKTIYGTGYKWEA